MKKVEKCDGTILNPRQPELTVRIHPDDFDKVHWDDLCEFLRYQCKYGNARLRTKVSIGKRELATQAISSGEDLVGNDTRSVPRAVHGEVCVRNGFEQENLMWKDDQRANPNAEGGQAPFDCSMQLIVDLLSGNELSLLDIAEATGLSLNSARRVLNHLVSEGIVKRSGVLHDARYGLNNESS